MTLIIGTLFLRDTKDVDIAVFVDERELPRVFDAVERAGAMIDRVLSLARGAGSLATLCRMKAKQDHLWQQAAAFAARVHQHHIRRDQQTPYFSHPAAFRFCSITIAS